MANITSNKLSVIGPDAVEFSKLAKKLDPIPGNSFIDLEPAQNKVIAKPNLLSFHAIVPLNEEKYCSLDYTSFGYQHEYETWGIKWGAMHAKRTIRSVKHVEYNFDTAWDCANTWVGHAATNFPKLNFYLSWAHEALEGAGRVAYENGSKIFIDEFSTDYDLLTRPGVEAEDEDKKYNFYYSVINMFLDSHEVWVQNRMKNLSI